MTFSHHVPLASSGWWQFLRLPLFLMTMTVLRNTGQVFCGVSLDSSSSDIFLVLRLGLKVWGGSSQRCVPFASHNIKENFLFHELSLMMLTLIIWLTGYLSVFSISKLLFFHLFHTMLFRGRCYVQPALKRWYGITFPIFNGRICTQIIWFSSVQRFFYSSPLIIYSIIYLYQFGYLGIYYILWTIFQYHIVYCGAQTVRASSTGNSFSWFLHPFDIYSSCFLSTTLLSGTVKWSRFIC